MSVVAFIGLGKMGAPMARNLLRSGHDVVGHNRSPQAMSALVADGARTAGDARAAAAEADAVFLCLPDSSDVEQVALSPDGILSVMRAGAVLIDCTTTMPSTARLVSEAASDQGVLFVDAPVSGGEQGAIEGTLSAMVGGDERSFAAAEPFLRSVAASIEHVGPAGNGQITKAANQLLVGGTLALVSEALLLLEAHGVPLDPSLRVLNGGLAASRVLERKAGAMSRRDFTPGFRVALHAKDIRILDRVAEEVGLDLALGSEVGRILAGLVAAGHGDLDHGAILLAVSERVVTTTTE